MTPYVARAATEATRGEGGTRLTGAWTAVVVGLITLVVILVFILQNQKSVDLSFLVFSGRLPLAVALLFAMILGALIVFAFGAARILQLRMAAGRARRGSAKVLGDLLETQAATSTEGTSD